MELVLILEKNRLIFFFSIPGVSKLQAAGLIWPTIYVYVVHELRKDFLMFK